ncbi:hypothetical protein LTR24_008469 [Lithohypha guttulata]|uniref:Telomeric single stranded DNA binding POT1/Cdc13 domain-containing protein n=1 Tax=Lithohypha guttulata TaxID=1690604 RepID=A0ABR0K047_9EURO|nr:hypothetical protein LTR24_008469 [Lithohypha guttulata]
MATSSENEEAHAALSNSTRIHIAHLNPACPSEDKHIEADVVLVWPYSSGTQELSLLLAERDVSLRKVMGQVKATFHAAVAREVARSKPGIGDSVRLSLRDVELVQEQNEVHTPGRKAAFTLHSFRAVLLELFTTEGQRQLIDFVPSTTSPTSSPQPSSPATNGTLIAFDTPTADRALHVSRTRAVSGSASILRTSQRLSSNSFPGSMVDPFTQEDGYVEGRGRKRTKFARHSGAWRFVNSDDENNDIDSPREHGHVRASSPPTDQILEDGDVLDLTEEPSPVKTNATEPSRPEAVPVEELQLFKHASVEHGAASSVEDQDNAEYKGFERSPSPESRSDVESELSASSSDRIIPVERMSRSPDEATGTATPRLEAVAPPGLPIVPPVVSRDQHSPPFLSQPSVLDANAQEFEPPDAFFQVPAPQSPNLALIERPETFAQPSLHEVQRLHHDNDAFLAIPLTDVAAQGIDLDFLQQQIDIENGENLPTELAEEVIEDEDMYGPLVPARSAPELGSKEQHTSPRQSIAPVSNVSDPITLDDDDDDDNEAEEGDESEESENDEDGDDLRMGPSKSPRLNMAGFEADETVEVVEEYHELGADGQEGLTDRSTSTSDSSPASVKPDTTLVVNRENRVERESEHTHIDLDMIEDTASSEDDAAVDYTDEAASEIVALAPPKSPQFHHGAANEILPEAMPLLPVDVVNIELQPAVVQHSEMVNSTYVRSDVAAEDSIPEVASSHDDTEEHRAIAAGSLTPRATQTDEPSEGDQMKRRSDLVHETSQTSFENHQPPPEEADYPSEVLLPPLPQLDGTPARRASRRLLDKPRMSDDIYSDYFTPRRSAVKSKDHALSQTAKVSESQEGPKPSHTVNHGSHHVDEGLQMSPEGRTSGMKLPNAADDVPWASSRGTITDMGYYVYLEYLGDYYDQLVDVLAVCTADGTPAERAKSGPKDFNTTIHLAGPSAPLDSNPTVTAQIFRPRKHAIPAVTRGDVILLRNFKVQTQSHEPFLLSTDESSWAVFSSAARDATMAGPPVEFGNTETAFVSRLLEWWASQGKDKYPDLPTQKQPAHDRPTVKKPAPQPLDLRRSPRSTRPDRTAEDTEAAAEQVGSPSFNPQSPNFSPTTAQSAITPDSASIAGPSSPVSASMMRSTRGASASAVEASETDETNTASPSPAPSISEIPRSHDRHVHVQWAPSMDRAEGEPKPARRTSAEDDSTVISEGETSVSSKRRHRHERRSTSLIHELRDGTQWVDIDDFEVVSVSEEETEETEEEDGGEGDGDNADRTSFGAAPSELAARDVSPQTAATDTPSKRPRGRPRRYFTGHRGRPRKTNSQHPHENSATIRSSPKKPRALPHKETSQQQQEQQQQPSEAHAPTDTRPQSSHSQGDTTAAATGTGRMTRSKAAKDHNHNVHELRDGATYED